MVRIRNAVSILALGAIALGTIAYCNRDNILRATGEATQESVRTQRFQTLDERIQTYELEAPYALSRQPSPWENIGEILVDAVSDRNTYNFSEEDKTRTEIMIAIEKTFIDDNPYLSRNQNTHSALLESEITRQDNIESARNYAFFRFDPETLKERMDEYSAALLTIAASYIGREEAIRQLTTNTNDRTPKQNIAYEIYITAKESSSLEAANN
jgi:type II secretory pathway pseudopilin PulG